MPVTNQSFGRTPPPASAPAVGESRVRMLIQRRGLLNGNEWPGPGGEIVLPADFAARLVRDHLAELVEPDPELEPAPEPEPVVEEAAVIQDDVPPERAVVPRAHSARPARRSKQKGK